MTRVCRYPVKLWLRDIKSISFQRKDNGFIFHNKFITKVDVIGVVKTYDDSKPRVLFKIDDATDTIMCSANYETLASSRYQQKLMCLNDEIEQLKNAGAVEEQVAQALLLMSSQAKKSIKDLSTFRVGDCVQVRGFVSDFREELWINSFEVCILEKASNTVTAVPRQTSYVHSRRCNRFLILVDTMKKSFSDEENEE